MDGFRLNVALEGGGVYAKSYWAILISASQGGCYGRGM